MDRFFTNSLVTAAPPSAQSLTRKSSIVSASLIDPRFEHDSCGVGFVASVDAVASHKILEQALTALGRWAHRGATAADGKSSDGVGVLAAIPRTLVLRATNIELDDKQMLGVGMLLLPLEETRAEAL